jgi:NAD(P)-dependent dehydrogenase (short-subunit alcohol dehydrogenase family)
VAAAFLAHLRGKPGATLVNVSSGLAFVPLARFPVYCATKAAVHSLTMSLRPLTARLQALLATAPTVPARPHRPPHPQRMVVRFKASYRTWRPGHVVGLHAGLASTLVARGTAELVRPEETVA